MTKYDNQVKATVEERLHQIEAIKEKYGRGKVKQATRRLCLNCSFEPRCVLCPITSDGGDCPYFDKKAEEAG